MIYFSDFTIPSSGAAGAGDRPYFRSAGSGASGTGAIVPSLPSDWKENDILILAVQSANQLVSAPSGWEEITDSPQGTGTAGAAGSTRLTLFWRRATASESAPTVADSGDHTLGIIFAVCGAIETGNPFDDTAGDVEGTASNSITWPGITTTTDNALVFNVMGSSSFLTDSSGSMTNASLIYPKFLFNVTTQSGVDGRIFGFEGLKYGAGSVSSSTSTFNLTNTATQGRITLSVKPKVFSSPIFISAGASSSSTTAATPGIPPGYQENDIFVMLVESANQAASAPSGWEEVSASPQGTGTAGVAGGTRLTMFWRRATASESAPTVADTGDHTFAVILCFRGCPTSGNPFDVLSGDVESVASSSATFPSVTTTVNNCLIINAIGHDTDLASSSQLSGWANSSLAFVAEVYDASVSTTSGGGLGASVGIKATAGSTGATTATLASAVVQGRITAALKPA